MKDINRGQWLSKTNLQASEGSSLDGVVMDSSITWLGLTSVVNVIGGVLVVILGPTKS